ncbi:MAG TPA: hypothetical protein VL983_10420 [Terriglobales bacterium]|nr:hypothetical protein [Terriglobales bacterium]
MKRISQFAGAATVAIALASVAPAQEGRIYREGSAWVQEVTGQLNGAKNMRVRLDMGSVKIEGGSQSGITYVIHRRAYTGSEERARREFQSNRISASVKGDTASIMAEGGGGRDRKCSDDLTINVPRSMDLAKIETGGGNVTATAINGRVELSSGGGIIRVDDIGNGVRAETGGGSIEIGSVGGDANLETGGGNIKINSVKGEIKASTGGGSLVVLSGLQGAVLETGGGSIRLQKCNGRVKATTGGGSIDLGDIGGPVEIQSGAGSIRLASAKGRVEAETGGGSIQLDGATSVRAETAAGGIVVKLLSSSDIHSDSSLETAAGDITVYLTNDLPISVRASIDLANGHTIRSDFGDIHVTTEGGQWGPRTVTAEGQLKGGGPMLKVRTSSGNISFLRASR